MTISDPGGLVSLDISTPIWDRFFMVAPLVLIGTCEKNGDIDLAPKHMVMPMGWDNYIGFVCTERHNTYKNIRRSGEFTVSFPRPSQLLYTSLAASPRCGTKNEKSSLAVLPTFPAKTIKCDFIKDAYLFFECRHYKTIDGFGINSLVTGEIMAAYVDKNAQRISDLDDQDLIHDSPLLAYLHPGRFATIDTSNSFPFPSGMKK